MSVYGLECFLSASIVTYTSHGPIATVLHNFPGTLQLQLQLQSYTLQQKIVLREVMQCCRLVGKDESLQLRLELLATDVQ